MYPEILWGYLPQKIIFSNCYATNILLIACIYITKIVKNNKLKGGGGAWAPKHPTWERFCCQQWTLFSGPMGCRCAKVWLYFKFKNAFTTFATVVIFPFQILTMNSNFLTFQTSATFKDCCTQIRLQSFFMFSTVTNLNDNLFQSKLTTLEQEDLIMLYHT